MTFPPQPAVADCLQCPADPSAVSALHAPTSKPWVGEQEYYFLGVFCTLLDFP